MSRPSQASAPGKVILLGEHAVVYGHPALAIPLDRGVLVRAEPAKALRLKTVPASGAAAVQEALAELAEGLGNPQVEVSIDSSIPLSAGLGSSAAVAVAMARALASAADRTLSEEELLALAERMERRFHGHPSGIDHTTCARAAPLRFVRGEPRHEVRLLRVPAMNWVVAMSGPRQGTREKVASLRMAYEQEPERIGALFSRIGALADQGVQALERADANALGALMDENQAILAGLGLSTETIDALCRRMRASGATGAKLTGAGGGGAVIALHPEPEKLLRELDRDGIRAFVARWEGISMKATARAHPNIALIKYWGKRDERLLLPHQSSFSVTLGELWAETTVEFGSSEDQGELGGRRFTEKELSRVVILLDAVRERAGISKRARVVSRSNFPTAAGLASSAAGFAALAMAGASAAGLTLNSREASVLARLGSGSACRSIRGGFVEWLRGTDPEGQDSYAVQRFPADHWPELRLLAAECASEAKAVSSRDAMRTTVETSPYYAAWVAEAEASVPKAKELVATRDFAHLGALCERNAWRMHATSLAADEPTCFLRPATLAVIEAVAALRRSGTPAFFTLDAGPNPVVLTLASTAAAVEGALRRAGALKVTTCTPGPDATLLAEHLF